MNLSRVIVDEAAAPSRGSAAAVEHALAAAAEDPERITDLLGELRAARLWLPLPDGEGPLTSDGGVQLPTVRYLGSEFVPAFSSPHQLSAWASGDGADPVPHLSVPAAALASNLPPGIGIALNPGAVVSVPIYPEGIALLAS